MNRWIFSVVVTLFLALLCSSCFTQALWDNVNPDENIWIPDTAITEAELIKKGVEYKKFGGSDPHGYLVKKSSLRKFGDYTVLTLATPITLVVDGTIVAVYLWVSMGGPGVRWQ